MRHRAMVLALIGGFIALLCASTCAQSRPLTDATPGAVGATGVPLGFLLQAGAAAVTGGGTADAPGT